MKCFFRKRIKIHSASQGFTLIEMIAAMTIMLVLTTIALPMAAVVVKREKERELSEDLRTMRNAIDRYKDFADRGMIPTEMDTYGYPPTLQILVDGVPLKGSKDKYKFLRKIPVDPMTGGTDWGMRSMQDDPDSQSWGGQDVFDVFSKSQGAGMNGIPYADW
jgi:general secretion pathway protein G